MVAISHQHVGYTLLGLAVEGLCIMDTADTDA
jgi:hypothetical protein